MADTPMVAQYKRIKAQHMDKILFFRLGDFYEMFFEDAEIAARELEITLTGRDAGKGKRMPMCGVPYHAADSYIARLLEKGYKVAICEQVEDPKTSTGLVKREVTRIVTPGTFLDPQVLEAKKNNYLAAVAQYGTSLGMAIIDAGTGDFKVTGFNGPGQVEALRSEMLRLQPAECLYPQDDTELQQLIKELQQFFPVLPSPRREGEFSLPTSLTLLERELASVNLPEGEEFQAGACAAGAILFYLRETQKVDPIHIKGLEAYRVSDYMVIDGTSRRNLELTRSLRGDKTRATLLGVLDYTFTAMGGRTLRQWVEQPLLNKERIEERLEAVEDFVADSALRTSLPDSLKDIYDLERLMGKVVYQTATARDLLALKRSLALLPAIKEALAGVQASRLAALREALDPCTDLWQLLEDALNEDPPAGLREGNLIKTGYHQEVDRLRTMAQKGRKWLAELEVRERERTGIKNLKIGYNKVFGYYLEVTKSNLDAVPQDYIRKQTLVNAERFITPELKEWEAEITGAQDRCIELEYQLFLELRQRVAGEIERVQRVAKIIGEIDSLLSLALAAIKNRYNKPVLTTDNRIIIQGGRHPVVEQMLTDTPFVPNDTLLDSQNQFLLITGPNMAGKSTYIRQVALIVLMAQMGSFVPAKAAEIGVVDRIFTRVGAADDLASGQSTFMVEMNEVGNILRNATGNSLVILDEIGRGTSTYDGLAIARAVAEYILEKLGAKTLFATHYHELTTLANDYQQVKNYTIAVEEQGKDIIFLRKIIPGASDRSYGVHVARLARLPEAVIRRAEEILTLLEGDQDTAEEIASSGPEPVQLDLFSFQEREVLAAIQNLDPLNMTPLEALQVLVVLQSLLKGE
ncbi:MAG: DNA mismatch repair protein MutS [bacterium]|nr:DNA mismatch repair protein MutS [Bacillota bacterium]HHW55331.1 DNA mismatch repair protein MutS [Bacillota bacterium]